MFTALYPHIAGRPSWYSSVYTCSENASISDHFDPSLEKAVTKAVKDYLEDLSQRHPFQPMRRGQHARSIACLKANFKVLENIPKEYRHGVFAQPNSYKAWVRISPGQSDIKTDKEAHARGFAIKLTGVPGEKLIDDEKQTQDFILLNSPVFFTGDNHDYVKLIPNMDNPLAILDFRGATYKLLGMLVYVAKMLSWSDNPLTHSFYSTTPYRLGKDLAVKYTATPCGPIAVEYPQGPSQMRDAIRATLDTMSGQEVCYNFYVQKRVDPCTEPIEDPTIPWGTDLVHVARITFPKQNFMYKDQFEFCEALSYNPWHSLADHKPLGSINHVRRMVYEESKHLRTVSGNYTTIEPTGKETFEKPIKNINFDLTVLKEPAGNTRHYTYGRYSFPYTDLSAIPGHVVGVPPGEDFEVSTFLALIMRMFVGDHTEMSERALTDDDDSFLEAELEGLLTHAANYAALQIQAKAFEQRLKEAIGISEVPSDVDTQLAKIRSAIFGKIVAFFRRGSKLQQNQDFASAIDTITTIFKKSSKADIASFKDPQEYETLFSRVFTTTVPWVVEDGKWRRDDVFGAQFIRGVNPCSIRRALGAFPADLKLNEAHMILLTEQIRRIRPAFQNESIDSVLAKGEIFYAEYSILKGLHRVEDARLHEPIVLFTLSTNEDPALRELLPIAIQFEDGRTFYPPQQKDCANKKNFGDHECIVWLFAKMHVMSADANVHESFVHLGMTHLLMEPAIVAARRQFAITHPIFRAMSPHFHQTIAINNEGRDTLINADGIFQRTTALGIRGSLQLINRGFERLNFTQWGFPTRMEAAGFPNIPHGDRLTKADTLPGYLYRDFCYDLWYPYHDYFTEVVNTVYPDEKTMLEDSQLQGFAFELSSPRFANLTTFPTSFTSREMLAETMTILAYTASVQHSAVNFGQFGGYGFVPNRPLTLTKEMPKDLSKLDMAYIMAALPNRDRSFGQMAVTFALSTPPVDTGDAYPLEWAAKHSDVLSPAPEAFNALISRFKVLKERMRGTIVSYGWNYYTYVFPDTLAVSIAI